MQDSDHRYKPTRSKTGERFPSLGEDGRWREDERAGKVSKEIFEIHCARISRWFELPSGPQPTWGGGGIGSAMRQPYYRPYSREVRLLHADAALNNT